MSESNKPNANEPDDQKVQALTQKLEILSLKLEKQALESQMKAPASKPWWGTLLEFLALPAAILAIVLQITQTSGTFETQEKTVAETEKIRTEEIKTRVELQQLLDSIAEKKQKGVQAYRDEVERTLPQLKAAVERLQALESQSSRFSIGISLTKFVILWVVFHAVDLAFDVLAQVWATLLSGTAIAVFNRKEASKEGRRDRIRRERMQRFMTWSVTVLSPVPSILRWSIQLSIFIALVIPLFDELAKLLGSNVTFISVFESAKALKIGEAIGKIRIILFGS